MAELYRMTWGSTLKFIAVAWSGVDEPFHTVATMHKRLESLQASNELN